MKFLKKIFIFLYTFFIMVPIFSQNFEIIKEEWENISCYGKKDGKITVFADYGNIPYTYSLQQPNIGIVGPYVSGNIFQELDVGRYIINVKDHNGIVITSSVFEMENPTRDTIAIDLSMNDTVVCPGNSLRITAKITNESGFDGPYYCTINGVQKTLPFYVSPKISPTNYLITAEKKDKCFTGKANLNIKFLPYPEVSLDSKGIEHPYEGCAPFTLYLQDTVKDGRGKRTYKWDFDEPELDDKTVSPRFIFKTKGSYPYKLSVKSGDGCVKEIFDTIRVFPNVEAKFKTSKSELSYLNPIVFFENNSKAYDSCYWTFGDDEMYYDTISVSYIENEQIDTVIINGQTEFVTSIVTDTIYEIDTVDMTSNLIEPHHNYEFAKPGTNYYAKLIVANRFSCKDSFVRKISFFDQYSFYIPNVFNVNSKIPENAVFIPKGNGIDENNFRMLIFNRWGEKVFETNNLNYPWNGRINGGDFGETASYTWLIIYKDKNGTEFRRTGNVILLH
ncbi:MAG: hypothetical protein B6I24_11255 [Bacteroidetes bacterium 4572_128]|nr:MAG: hypothetical protein B6I24_11255 [Bacteroidetes bacterium 4572_128]